MSRVIAVDFRNPTRRPSGTGGTTPQTDPDGWLVLEAGVQGCIGKDAIRIVHRLAALWRRGEAAQRDIVLALDLVERWAASATDASAADSLRARSRPRQVSRQVDPGRRRLPEMLTADTTVEDTTTKRRD